MNKENLNLLLRIGKRGECWTSPRGSVNKSTQVNGPDAFALHTLLNEKVQFICDLEREAEEGQILKHSLHTQLENTNSQLQKVQQQLTEAKSHRKSLEKTVKAMEAKLKQTKSTFALKNCNNKENRAAEELPYCCQMAHEFDLVYRKKQKKLQAMQTEVATLEDRYKKIRGLELLVSKSVYSKISLAIFIFALCITYILSI